MNPFCRRGLAFGILIVFAPIVFAPAFASASEGNPGSSELNKWGFRFNLGAGEAEGEFDDLLTHQLAGEFDFFRAYKKWRFGFGLNFSSFEMVEPYEHEPEWGYQRTGFFAQYVLTHSGRLRPYLEARAALARLHPRSELFEMDPLPEDFEVGDSPTEAADGFTLGLGAGLEYKLTRAFALDASLLVSPFWVEEYDLSAVGRPPASSGTTWEARLGVVWWPWGEFVADSSSTPRDAWYVKPSWGWAIGEMMAINLGASGFNEYVRNANFNQISPRSWWDNLTGGFHYDDNKFRTNQYIHPFNGSTYYNSGRANGLDFWESSIVGIGGAFFWEAFGETHPMSWNDQLNTSLGGIAVGEMSYRMSSLVLDNTATGSGRTWREIGAFLIDPVRGFNRLLSGKSADVHANPVDPIDWRPPGQRNRVAIGARIIGEGESISDNTENHGFVELTHAQGTVFENHRRGPYDFFDLNAQINFGDKVPLGKALIRGDLWSKPLGVSASPDHVFSIVQHFDYINNNAYEFGGQSFGPTLNSRFGDPRGFNVATRVDLMWTVIGAVNSDYAFLAEVENRERFREYDYGTGGGGSIGASFDFSRKAVLDLFYRAEYLAVRNGSIYSTNDFDGSDADHVIQAAVARLLVPVRPHVSVGMDGTVFLRNSDYSLPTVADEVTQRNPQIRVYLSWNLESNEEPAVSP
jgi:hypothetical protein